MTSISELLRKGSVALRDLVWPWATECYVCGRPIPPSARHDVLCPACSAALAVSVPRCIRCGRRLRVRTVSPGDQPLCQACRLDPPPFERLYTLGPYEGSLGALIRGLKYRHDTYLVPYLVSRMCLLLTGMDVPRIVVPMPIHPGRLRQRGFNQAALLAAGVAKCGPDEYLPGVLLRRKATRRLADLDPLERLAETRNAFVVHGTDALRGRTVLLVDDVLTTGASAGECARVLRDAGAAQVEVLVVARAELHTHAIGVEKGSDWDIRPQESEQERDKPAVMRYMAIESPKV